MTSALVSIGVAGSLGPDATARVASAAQAAGLHALWVNDTPGGDSLASLAAAARVTDALVLATGVIPVDRRPPASFVDALRALPHDRLTLGVGSGQARAGALALVRNAVAELRELTSARLLVGALGPRMRELAVADADGPLLSWLTPALAGAQAQAAHAARAHAHVALYVRAALDPAATGRLDAEAARYAGYPAYAAHFARLGVAAGDTVLAPERFAAGIPPYRDAVDEVVLRAITATDDVDEYVRFVDRAAELLA
ncbi:MAG: LLM class flavin-dependent oxidoreductase [Microbacterium sp.]